MDSTYIRKLESYVSEQSLGTSTQTVLLHGVNYLPQTKGFPSKRKVLLKPSNMNQPIRDISLLEQKMRLSEFTPRFFTVRFMLFFFLISRLLQNEVRDILLN
jgi:hypothetical protein